MSRVYNCLAAYREFKGYRVGTVRVVALLCVQAVAAFGLMTRYSVTIDEAAHIPSGLSIWYDRDFSLYNVNPPLAKAVATVLLVLRDDVSVGFLLAPRVPQLRDEFAIACLFSEMNRAAYQKQVVTARLAGLFWLFGGGFLLWRFASQLYGPASGLIALAMWVTEPFVTAHGALATPDLPGAVAAIAVVYVTWRSVRARGGMRSTLAVSILLGLAILIKLTNLILVPVIVALFIMAPRREGVVGFRVRRCGHVLAAGTLSFVTIWCGYLFDGVGTRWDDLPLRSKLFSRVFDDINRFTSGSLSMLPVPLPPELIRGIDVQQVDFEGRQQSYLRGTISDRGWSYYYAYALLVKLAIGSVILCAVGLTLSFWMIRQTHRHDSAAVLLPIIAFFVVLSLKSSFTNHARYALPCLPFLFLCASRLGEPMCSIPNRLRLCLVVSLLTWNIISAGINYPNWLGYFNEAAGGPTSGWWHLEDSNVDWGQDLILLRDWIDRNPRQSPIYVRTHHVIDTSIYLEDRASPRRKASYIAVDAYSLVHNERGLWRRKLVDRVGTSFFVFYIGSGSTSSLPEATTPIGVAAGPLGSAAASSVNSIDH